MMNSSNIVHVAKIKRKTKKLKLRRGEEGEKEKEKKDDFLRCGFC